MQNSTKGLIPSLKLPENATPYLQKHCRADWHCIDPLIDSSAIGIEHWQQWLNIIANAIEAYDGILILHGTDTLAYTAAVFARAIEHIHKPIILTGAQKSLYEQASDAADNLQAAAALFKQNYHGIGIVFANTLLDGKNSSKISTEHTQAFADTQNGALGHYNGKHWNLFRQPEKPTLPCTFAPIASNIRIITLHLTPGHSIQHATYIMENHLCDGFILLSYGNGNAPNDPHFIQAIRHFTQTGGMVYNISQIAGGKTTSRYAQNHPLTQAGAINSPQGIEATYAHMLIILSKPTNTLADQE